MLHIMKEYATGVGHIEERGGHLMVTFYGRRVRQVFVGSLEAARRELRRLSLAA